MLASTAGGTVGMLIFVVLLSRGFQSLTASAFSTNFYDEQAKSFLHGHLWVPGGVASLEGIQYGGHTYIYFGPFLALLRTPIIWLAPGLTGHLSQLSMIAAGAALVAGASWLSWGVRSIVSGGAGVRPSELVLQGGFCAALLGGSVALYLAGSPSVYFETELWGAALASAALAAFVSFVRTGATLPAAVLGVTAASDALTRVSVAIGPVILLVGSLTLTVLPRLQKGPGRGRIASSAGRNPVFALAAGLIASTALPAWFNWAKFRSLISVPWNHQVVALHTPAVEAFYRHHGVFALDRLPSTIGWYLRPWTLLTTGLFPFFGFRDRTPVASPSDFLALGRSSSIPSSMPLLFVLGAAGALILAVPRVVRLHPEPGTWTALRLAAFAAAASAAPILLFDTIANRYLADVLPLLVLVSLIALWTFGCRWRPPRRAAAPAAGFAVIGLAIYSALANLSLGLQEALVFGPSPTPEQKAGLASWQLSIHQALPIPLSFPASHGPQPPPGAVPGQLFVQDGCAGVYQYNGPIWNQLEVGALGGRRVLDVQVPVPRTEVTEPLLVAGTRSEPGTYQYFSLQYGPSSRYRIVYESRPWDVYVGHPAVAATPWHLLPVDRHLHMVLTIAGKAPDGGAMEEARIPGVLDFFPEIPVTPSDNWTVGGLPGGPEFSGPIHADDVPTPLCALASRAIRSSGG